jgi:hypothetical protein
VNGEEIEVDYIIYATGFEVEVKPLHQRVGRQITGRGGVTLVDKWGPGAANLCWMTSRGFPNMFILPAPGQQAVVTVNYTHLAVEGAEHIAKTVRALDDAGVTWFDITAKAENAWCQSVIESYLDSSALMSACSPSRLNNEVSPEAMLARNGNYGGGFGDFFEYQRLLADWRAAGDFEGFEVHPMTTGP